MIKRFSILTIILALLLLPAALMAKANHELGIAESIVVNGNIVTVPVVITNQDNLAAMDIPLSFSEGVTLKEVIFKDTRVSKFDLQAAVIDNENNTVVLGLVAQIASAHIPDLEAGTGVVANLVFEIVDPSIVEIVLETVKLEAPDHELLFVYHDFDVNGIPSIREEYLDFNRTVLSLVSGSGEGSLPKSFALNQNFPNPFNPSTNISFDLPVASRVTLTVYNILGQEVVQLVDDYMEAGSHSVSWNASSVSSGVYFYRITAEAFNQTRKMVLLK